jgi:amino acid permease
MDHRHRHHHHPSSIRGWGSLRLRGGAAAAAPVVKLGTGTKPSPRASWKKLIPKKPATKSTSSSSSSSTTGNTGTASIPNEIFNLVKAIVGVTVLSLPAGIANFGDSRAVVVPAVVVIAIMGMLSGYSFAVTGKVCAYTGAKSYREAWDRSVSTRTSWIPAASATLKTFLACLAISMVLGDTFAGLLGLQKYKVAVLLTLTTVILLPLCWMKSLSALAPFSLLGVICMLFTGIAMSIRFFDGSYEDLSSTSSTLLQSVPMSLRPSFGDSSWKAVWDSKSLIYVCMLSAAFLAHFNAPKLYNELQNNTLPRFYSMVAGSYGISIFLMGIMTALGFLTFGSHVSGVVLHNYAAKDAWIGVARVAVAISLIFSYPLSFQGCRDGLLDLLSISGEKRTNRALNIATLGLLGMVTFLATVLNDVSFVLAFGGATLGNALSYIYPAIMYASVVKKQGRKDESIPVAISVASAILGVVIGVIGTKMALEKF